MLDISQLFWFWFALVEGKEGASVSSLATLGTGTAIALLLFLALKVANRYMKWIAH